MVRKLGESKSKGSPKPKEEKTEIDTTRVQLQLSPKSYDCLNRLKGKLEASSYQEVSRRSYSLHEKLLDHVNAGHKFFVQGDDGVMIEITMLIG